jgi:ATP-dependent protease ClpP protease subunit
MSQARNAQIFLGVDNSVTLRGPIDDASVLAVMLKLAVLNAKRGLNNYSLYLVLDSPGGGIDAGDTFIQYAKTIRNLHTITIASASMAAGIVGALPGNRYITDNGLLMFHRARGGVQGQIEEGEVETRLAMIKKLVLRMEYRNANRMRLSISDYKKAVKDELWLSAADAVSSGAADRVVDLRCTEELINKRESVSLQVFIFNFKLEFSACPLFRNPLPMQKKEDQENFLKYEKQIYQELRGYKNLMETLK